MRIDPTDVPDGWRIARLGDIAEVRGGVGFPLERQGRREGAYPFIKVSDMNVGGNGTYIRSANNYVDQTDVSELGAHVFLPGTVVFPKVGAAIATNKKRVLTVPTIIDNNLMGVTVSGNERCDSRFLHRWFTLTLLEKLANVSTVPSITSSRLKKQAILLPPIQEQRAIAGVLDSIDKAIESTDETVAATERLRDALLHELLTRGLPGQHSEWTEVPGLGTIPASWRVIRLGDVCDRPEYGANAPALPFDHNLPRYVRITDITDDGRLRRTNARSADPERVEGYELQAGDLLLARSGSVGRSYLYRPEDGPCVYAGYLIRFQARSNAAVPRFIELWTRGPFYRKWVTSMLRAGAQPNINATEYSSLPVLLPSLAEQQGISDIFDSVDGAIERERDERDALHESRTSIAEALLTGRVRTASLCRRVHVEREAVDV